jgi:energy-converting hydrogenase B subunit I
MKGKDESMIVKNVACALAVPITMFGFYVILHGHLTPGGGFAGGAVMATLIVLFLVSFRKEMSKDGKREPFFLSETLGLLAFISLTFIGISVTFFHNFLANSGLLFGTPVGFGANPGFLGTGGTAPLMNMAVGLEVFSGLSLIVLLMARRGGGKDD